MPPFAPNYEGSGSGSDSEPDRINANRINEVIAANARYKRRITELEETIKKALGKTATATNEPRPWTFLGRPVCKVVAAFDQVEDLIGEDDRRANVEEARTTGNEVHGEEETPTLSENLLMNGYKELLRFIVPLRKVLADGDEDLLASVLASMRVGARNARSDDTKNIRAAIVPWLNLVIPSIDPALDPDSRDNRGLYHDDLGALLCPIEFDWDDEEVRTAIREGDAGYQVTANSWWVGLYPAGAFDAANPDIGLFMNMILLKVYKFIFTSPLSVKTMPDGDVAMGARAPAAGSSSQAAPALASKAGKKNLKKTGSKSKRNVAAIIGLKAATGRSIAYAAVHYRVALSDAHHWDDHDGDFDYTQFYNNIVEYFEFPPGPRARADVERLLDWWNINVFGTTPRWSLYEGGAAAGTSSVSVMRAARVARETES
ncbi:hypothetical protein C8R43DRAFT_1133490 [Mycena crocata]|nr:hypothetical protein C8R43DRAFT_1133490 [Mycena crocata]